MLRRGRMVAVRASGATSTRRGPGRGASTGFPGSQPSGGYSGRLAFCAQLNQNEQELSNAGQDLTKAQASYDTATGSAVSRPGSRVRSVGFALIQRLRDRESESNRLANLSERYGDTSPYVRPLTAELGAVRQQITSETTKIIMRWAATSRRRKSGSRTSRLWWPRQAQAGERGRAEATLAQLNQDVDAKRHVYTAFLTRMEQTQLTSTQFPSARVVSVAAPPPKSDGWPLWVIVFLGMIVGAFIAVAVILARLALGGRISSVKDVELITGTPPITSIPALRGAVDGRPIAARILDVSHSRLAETLHALSYSIQEMNPDAACTRVLVTSPLQGEGKTTLAASLARLSAASGKRVCWWRLICDARRWGKRFDLPRGYQRSNRSFPRNARWPRPCRSIRKPGCSVC